MKRGLAESDLKRLAGYYASKLFNPRSCLTFNDYESFAMYALLFDEKSKPVECSIIDQVRTWNRIRKPLRHGQQGRPRWVGAKDKAKRARFLRSRTVEVPSSLEWREGIELREAVQVALARIPEPARSIWWRVAQGERKDAIARSLGYSPSWVSLVLRSSRVLLRDCLLMALG